MSWVRIDDAIFDHPKFRDLSKDAKLLFFAGVTLSAKYLTDGRLSPSMQRQAMANAEADAASVTELLDSGLWDREDDALVIHDYLDYNLSAAQVEERKRHNTERQRRWREQQRAQRDADSTPDASRNGVTNGHNPYPVNPDTQKPEDPDPGPPVRAREAADAGGTVRSDPWLDAVCQGVYGQAAAAVLPSERDEARGVAGELEASGISPPEIAARCVAWRRHWKHLTLSPRALARNWTEIGRLAAGAGVDDAAHQPRSAETPARRRAAFTAAGLLGDADDGGAGRPGDADRPYGLSGLPESPPAAGSVHDLRWAGDGLPDVPRSPAHCQASPRGPDPDAVSGL